MTRRTPESRAARAVQKVSELKFCQALEWVRLNKDRITELCLEKKMHRHHAAAELWKRDDDDTP